MKKNIYLFLLIVPFLSLVNVSADIRVPSDIVINNSSNSFEGYQYIGNSTNNSNVDLRVGIVEDMTYAVDHPFLIVDICSSSDIYVDRSSSVGSSCTNSCFSNAVAKMKTTTSCKTNGVGGVIYRVQTQILKWSMGTQYFSLDDKFYVSVPKSGNNYLSVYGVYLSNDDIMVNGYDYSSNFTQIDNTITSKADSIINNQNQNTQDVIDNQNQNTQDVIDNQNANTDKEIESQKVCSYYDNTQTYTNGYINNYGNIIFHNAFGVSDFIKINPSDELTLLDLDTVANSANACFYNVNKIKISCINYGTLINGTNKINIPDNVSYFRYSFNISQNKPTMKLCKNGNQATNDTLNEFYNADIEDRYKSPPDTTNFDDYENSENTLKEKINQADLSVLDIGLDSNSTNWVWTTMTSLITSNSAIFGMFISILSIGIIKLALGR